MTQPKRHFSAAFPNYYYQKFYSPANERRNTAPNGYQGGDDESQPINLLPSEEDDRRRSSCTSANSERKFLLRTPRKTTLRVHYGGSDDDVIKQRKFYTKHKKTAQTLALVVGAFLVCWLPFFILYLISSTCDNECIPPAAMEAFTWLGYSNSAFNPIIYAVSMKTFGGGMRQTLARISSLCSFENWPCGRNRGQVSPGKRRQSRSPSSAVTTECTVLPDGTPSNLPYGRQSVTPIVLGGSDSPKWSWMRRRAASIGASLKNAKRISLKKPQLGRNPSKTLCIANETQVRRLSRLEDAATTSETAQPSVIEEEQKQFEDELMFYVHNFGPNCEDDFEIENSVAAAMSREESVETVIYLNQYREGIVWPKAVEDMKL